MVLTKYIAKHFGAFKNVPFVPILIDEQMKVFTMFFNPIVFSKMIEFVQELKNENAVKLVYHRYGGLEFRAKNKEFCHIHGDGLVDIILNKKESTELIEKGLCEQHHVHPNTGWISYQITKETELKELIYITKKALNLKLITHNSSL